MDLNSLICCDNLNLENGLPSLQNNSIDSIVTDPPYGLGKHPTVDQLIAYINGDNIKLTNKDFMGKDWAMPTITQWKECYRVIKPGGHMLVFAGSRTMDLMSLGIRVTGFEIRDVIMWCYGSGFPKSLNISKKINESSISNQVNEFNGWGTALKPAYEPILLVRKPLNGTLVKNILQYSTGGLNIDKCKIGDIGGGTNCLNRDENGKCLGHNNANQTTSGETFHGPNTNGGRWPTNLILDEESAKILDLQGPISKSKPTRVGKGGGRGFGFFDDEKTASTIKKWPGDNGGGISRFFYCAKASISEKNAGLDDLPIKSGGELTNRKDNSAGLNSPRAGAGRKGGGKNSHPTVKPISLMKYLVKLITPQNGLVLDPWCGSGSTGVACAHEGFNFIGMDSDEEYIEIAKRRIKYAMENKC